MHRCARCVDFVFRHTSELLRSKMQSMSSRLQLLTVSSIAMCFLFGAAFGLIMWNVFLIG